MVVTIWMGCAAANFRSGRRGARPEAIVVHIIVGSLRSADGTFGDDHLAVPRSAHYGVGRNGAIHQYVSESDSAFHAGVVDRPTAPLVRRKLPVNPNDYTIGIEHEGMPNDPWTPEQFEASSRLMAGIARRWNITLDREHVILHREIRASKTCPGSGVDVEQLMARAAEYQATTAVPVTRVAEGFPSTATVVRRVNVRQGQPSTAVPTIGALDPQSTITVSALVCGESVGQDNPWWCETPSGYVWSGATNLRVPLDR
jgi:N-acetylmuramoyl-L-alanine amidase